MTSYNQINGTYANENPHLLKDILRDEWGYDGIVLTDWGGSNDHIRGVAAGSDLEMTTPGMDSARQLEIGRASCREGVEGWVGEGAEERTESASNSKNVVE